MKHIICLLRNCLIFFFHKCRFGKRLQAGGLFSPLFSTQIIITQDSRLSIGKGVCFKRNVSLTACGGGVLEIGEGTSFNRNDIIICRNKIQIGKKVLFGPNVCIYDHDHEFGTNGIQKGYKTSPILIENGCWLGANSVILRGTHIGEGSVIGAGCVVKGNIPPHSLVTSDRTLHIRPIDQ